MPVQRLQVRHGTASEWTTANPVLKLGELGVETDTAQLKIGNDVSTWNALPYVGGGGSVASYELQLDDTGAGVTYVGEADPGSSDAAAVWRIKRITESGVDLHIEWAGGDAQFDNVWDDRAALSYS